MKKFISLSSIFGSHAFFVISVFIGYTYEGSSTSKSYIYYTLFITLTSFILFFYDCIVQKRKINIFVIFLPFIVAFLYLTTIFYGEISALAEMFFSYYIIWSMPALYIGMYFSWNNRHEYLFKWLDLIMILGSISSVYSTVVQVFNSNSIQGLAGGTNQSLSYVSAFVFGLNLFLNFVNYDFKRYKFVYSKWYSLVAVILLPLQIIAVVISGGRGGMVLILFYLFLFCINLVKSTKLIKYKLFYFSVLFTTVILIYSLSNEMVSVGLERVFEYIGLGEINWNGTSNRNLVYNQAIELIKKKPIIGYGLYGYLNYTDNPHNLILEVLLNGGVTYLLIFILSITLLIKKYINILKTNNDMQLIGIIAVFPIVMLFFSGTYMVSSELWFAIGFITAYSNKKIL